MSKPPVVIRKIKPAEVQQVSNLVKSVFMEFVAPHYERKGVDEFLGYIDTDRMASRLRSDHFILVAEKDGKLPGMMEIRNYKHISLLFVTRHSQRRGIARRLLDEAVAICMSEFDINEISVNSSPNAVEAYRKLGFKIDGQEQLKDGIRYIPMKLRIGSDNNSEQLSPPLHFTQGR